MADVVKIRHAIVISLDDLPEVDESNPADLVINGWYFDKTVPVTLDDLKVWVAALRWFEQHPEVVPDGE